jgi:hypothetical protein
MPTAQVRRTLNSATCALAAERSCRTHLAAMSTPRQAWFGWVVPSLVLVLGTIRRELTSSWRRDDRYAEIDRCDAGQALGLLPLLPEVGEGEVDALDLTQPRLMLGASAASQQVGLDLVEPEQHFWVDVEHGATQTGMLMLAGRTVWSRASAQLDFSPVEVFLEFGPLGVSDGPILVR